MTQVSPPTPSKQADLHPDDCDWPGCDCDVDDCCDGMQGLCDDDTGEDTNVEDSHAR